jgi:O-antigen ligase
VRTMAARREMREAMAWILFGSGVVLAAVCFLMSPKGVETGAIYGLRYTSGWAGWGPFPNRNHTASLLAMSAMMGLGCTVWSGARGNRRLAIAATLAVLVVLVALLVSKSRGGLVALAAGLAVFGGMMLWRHRSRRTLSLVAGGVALVAVVVVIFGSQVLDRFAAGEGKTVANQLRKDIWGNAVTMWRDAPLLGHGVETFTDLFPFYQHLTLDDNVVIHPESSWLQWLCELGLVPVVILTALLLRLVLSRLGPLFKRRGTFYLSAGALAAVAGLVVHSAIDVPGHRWATAGFALALLALACPSSASARRGSRCASSNCARAKPRACPPGPASMSGKARSTFSRCRRTCTTTPPCANSNAEPRRLPTGSGTSRSSTGWCPAVGATPSATRAP